MKTTVYTTKSCPYCVKVKQWLNDHDVAFDEARIDQDPAQMLTMIEKTAQTSVPCTIIQSAEHEHVIFGFDEAKLAAATGVLTCHEL